MDSSTSLRRTWAQAWRDLGLAPPNARVEEALTKAWAEPQRHYHTLQHLHECLALFDEHRALARQPGDVALAIWFHDAVYDTSRHDNEAASADWAVRVLADAGAPAEVAARVQALVMATRHSEVPATPDEALLVDIDLAILGADVPRFAEYERQIRDEYAFVPEAQFLVKRAEILQGFLDRDAIFTTPALAARLEAPARANLATAIARLRRAAADQFGSK